MNQLERADLHAAIEIRYPDNTTEDITPAVLRAGLHELVDSVFVTATDTGAVPNVPPYNPTTTYVVGFTVRYTPPGGSESFYAALSAGKLPAPVAVGDVNWKVVPGPVPATALGQEITLAQARNLNGDLVVLGRDYAIELPTPSASGHQQVLSVAGLAENWFASEGWLIVNNVRTKVKNIDLVAATWEVDTRYTTTQVDALLATKQGAIVEQTSTFIPPGSAGLTRSVFGTYLYATGVGASLVDLPPPLATDVGTLLAVFNVGGGGGGGAFSWQVQLPPGNPPPGFPLSTDPTGLDVVTPPGFAVVFEVVKVVRGFPYSDTVYSYVVLSNSSVQAPAFKQLTGQPSENPALFGALASKQSALTTQLEIDFNGDQTKPLYRDDFGKYLALTTTEPGSALGLVEPQPADLGKITVLTLASGPSPLAINCQQGGATASSTLGSLATGQTLLLGVVQRVDTVNGVPQPGPLRHVVLAREAGGTSGGPSYTAGAGIDISASNVISTKANTTPLVRVYAIGTTNQVVSNQQFERVNLNRLSRAVGMGYDEPNATFTAPAANTYSITASIQFGPNRDSLDNVVYLCAFVNGVRVQDLFILCCPSSQQVYGSTGRVELDLNEHDVVELKTWNNANGGIIYLAQATRCFTSIRSL